MKLIKESLMLMMAVLIAMVFVLRMRIKDKCRAGGFPACDTCKIK